MDLAGNTGTVEYVRSKRTQTFTEAERGIT